MKVIEGRKGHKQFAAVPVGHALMAVDLLFKAAKA